MNAFQPGEEARTAVMNANRRELYQPASIANTLKAMMGGKDRREFVSRFMQEFDHASEEELANEISAFLVAILPIWGQILVNLVASCLGSEDHSAVEDPVS